MPVWLEVALVVVVAALLVALLDIRYSRLERELEEAAWAEWERYRDELDAKWLAARIAGDDHD